MEPSKDKIYFLIESMRRVNMTAVSIHNMVNEAWPEQSMSLRHVQRLVKEFRDGDRDSFERARGSGRRNSDVRNENVEAVRNLLNEGLTVREIASELAIDKCMVHRILTDELECIWFHTKWIPHTLTNANKAVRVARCTDMIETLESRLTKENLVTIDEKWFYARKIKPSNKIGSWVSPGGDVVQTARRSTMEMKHMAIFSISLRGQSYFEVLERNESVNSERYIQFLNNMCDFYQNNPNGRGIERHNMVIIQDNAKPHTSRITTAFFADNHIKLLKQPPYSPDTNLCDRYLFPRLESLRDNNDLSNREDLVQFLNLHMGDFTAQRMRKALDSMVEDLQKIIDNDGNYVS